MSNQFQIVDLNYGCEVNPTLKALQLAFPDASFVVSTSIHGTFSSSWAIFLNEDADAKDVDSMRLVGSVFRDGFQKGFLAGWDDYEKHGVKCAL